MASSTTGGRRLNMTVGAALREALVRLANASDTPQLDAALLTAHALGIERTKLLTSRTDEIDDEAALRLDSLIIQRELGIPVAYLLGTAGFYGREFEVTPAVLIPRPETELLVTAALDHLSRSERPAPTIWDVGTGSGAIAITLAIEIPTANIVASDISNSAVTIAQRNAERHGVAQRIRFFESDLGDALQRQPPFDLIVANLPYVPSAEIPEIPSPLGYEPAVALDGGPDGLAVYARFVESLGEFAFPGTLAVAEAAPPTIGRLAGLFKATFPAANVEVRSDLGGLARFVTALIT